MHKSRIIINIKFKGARMEAHVANLCEAACELIGAFSRDGCDRLEEGAE